MLACWLVELLTCLVGWLVGWLVACLLAWLIGWLVVWLLDWLVVCLLTCSLAHSLARLLAYLLFMVCSACVAWLTCEARAVEQQKLNQTTPYGVVWLSFCCSTLGLCLVCLI